jgi:hypothetical protein
MLLNRIAVVLLPVVVLSATAPDTASAQASERAQVLILGMYHFDNPGLDVVKSEVADILLPARQAEVVAVVDAVARFRPTSIAVEHLPSMAPRLDSLFDGYRQGRRELGRNETQQIGFRLARMLGHERVMPIDHGGEFPFGAMMEYAQKNDPAFVGWVGRELGRITEETNRRQRENTVGEILRHANDPAVIAEGHGMYLRLAAVGAGDTYVGADLLSRWYERNIRIFANIQRIAKPGDRIVVVIGAGHAAILRELVASDPDMALVETLDYLPQR